MSAALHRISWTGVMMSKRHERMVSLVTALLTTDRPLLRSELRDHIELYHDLSDDAFRRTFERDKRSLRELGIPIDVVDMPGIGPNKMGYRIVRQNYELKPVHLTTDETDVLAMASTVWRDSVLDESAHSAIRKLRAVEAEPCSDADATSMLAAEVPDVTMTGPMALAGHSDGNDQVPVLMTATDQGVPVSFEYRAERVRHVDPWQVILQDGHWYLQGRDIDVDEARTFRVSRITSHVRLTGRPGTVVRPDSATMQRELGPLDPTDSEDIEAIVVLTGAVQLAGVRIRTLSDDEIPPSVGTVGGTGNSRVVHVTAPGLRQLQTAVLQAGGRAVVVGPPQVREQVMTWLQELVDQPWLRQASEQDGDGDDMVEVGNGRSQ